MDINKLGNGQKLMAGGTLLFLIAMFLPWFTFGSGGFSVSGNGFDIGALWGLIPLILFIAVAVVHVVGATKPDASLPPALNPLNLLIATGIGAALVVLKLLIGESALGLTAGRGIGLFLGTIAALAAAAGSALHFKENA